MCCEAARGNSLSDRYALYLGKDCVTHIHPSENPTTCTLEILHFNICNIYLKKL